MFIEHLLDRFEVAARWNHDAAFAENGLREEARDVARGVEANDVLKLCDALPDTFVVIFPR